MSPATKWQQDILGRDWVQRSIPLGADDEGPLDATLVRRSGPRNSQRAVLYVHGFVDYFFQTHMGEFFEQLGYDFYAVDLRKYGRSLHAGQTPNYVENLADYRFELDAAARIIADEGHSELVVVGHSTGGLVTSLWVNARAQDSADYLGIEITGLILNSPWFDLNKPWHLRVLATPLIAEVAKVAPRLKVGSLKPYYGRALHRDTGGMWDWDLALKPHEGFPVRAAWFTTIRKAHKRVAQGLHIPCPVLVLASDRSGSAEKYHDELTTTDSVLNVAHIQEGASKLGAQVTFVPVALGAHDLALSPEPARTSYFDAIRAWLSGIGDD